ncbi:MAG: response regulator transcription factor [Bacteroidetes bacterium]|nr:MAG: response regulator transcription factor [Bacteroidota bacterium]
MPVKVLIADSQFLITESLKFLLQSEGGFKVEKVVTEKSELIKELKTENISLLIVDHSLIDIGGISELKEIKNSFPDLKVLVITNCVTGAELHELNSAGITNIILKTACREELFEALDAAIKGKKYYSNELLDLLFEVSERRNPGDETGQLTISEIEIVRLISEGLTTKEIASRKFISFHTVISHRKNIFRKLGVSNISELIMYAIKAGWINMIEYHI